MSSWHNNSAKIFRLVSQCMGLMISQLRILRASSILWAFVVPSWCSYRLKKAGVPSLIQLTLIISQGQKLNWLGWLCGSAASRCPAGRGSCSTCELGRSASTGRRSRKAFRSDSAKSLDPFSTLDSPKVGLRLKARVQSVEKLGSSQIQMPQKSSR